MHRTAIGLALFVLCCLATPAQAGMLGQVVTAEWYAPDNVTVIETHNLLVGPGVELPFGAIANGPIVSIDLSDALIRFEFSALSIWTPVTVNGWKFSDNGNAIPPIVGVAISSLSGGVTGLSNSDFSFTTDSVFGNFSGVQAAGAGDFWEIKVLFADVPEPSSMLLAASGLAMLASYRLRRKQRANRRLYARPRCLSSASTPWTIRPT